MRGEVGTRSPQGGDCIAGEPVRQLETVPVVPCSDPLDVELLPSVDLSGDDWPGEVAAAEQAQEGWLAEFDAFIGLADEESAWEISTIHPSEVSWKAKSDREVSCGIYPVSDEDTAGSAKGIAESRSPVRPGPNAMVVC